jgi:diaminohydroxyphosphoribosylaminopyrimidine deaminase/5-amino-6-(5-phosphoribosylamino)uracil reductase
MQEALDLAQRGSGEVEPNPRVGAILLQDGQVVGRGYHGYYGGVHAEVAALEDARARGAKPDTAVVTLEPCSSQVGDGGKKTPPCTQALLAAGIRRVVVGAIDPDPRHRRRGLVELEQRGVEAMDDCQVGDDSGRQDGCTDWRVALDLGPGIAPPYA